VSDQKPKLIIKRVKKISGGGAHGGSWKVAYADFVTAMMAFFLLLWLLTQTSQEKRAAISTYFKHFSIFAKSGTSFAEKASTMFSQPGENAQQVPRETQGTGQTSGGPQSAPEAFKDAIKKAVEQKLGDIKDQIMVDVFEGGVRIQLVDKEGKPMFDLGSSRPTPLAARIMQVIGDQIKDLPNPVSVEGHTDSLAYKSSSYGNWELSTERALAAKKQLEGFGLAANARSVDSSQLPRVAEVRKARESVWPSTDTGFGMSFTWSPITCMILFAMAVGSAEPTSNMGLPVLSTSWIRTPPSNTSTMIWSLMSPSLASMACLMVSLTSSGFCCMPLPLASTESWLSDSPA
jgi:chemotaxis protein MotB